MPIFLVPKAPMRGMRQVEVSEAGLRVDGGPVRAWSDVTGMRHVRSRGQGGAVLLDLDVVFGAERETLSVNGRPAQVHGWTEMARALCDRVLAVRPDTPVEIGHSALGRALILVCAVALAGLAALLVALAFDAGLDLGDGEDQGLLGAGVIALLVAAGLVFSSPPWQRLPRISVGELRARLGRSARNGG